MLSVRTRFSDTRSLPRPPRAAGAGTSSPTGASICGNCDRAARTARFSSSTGLVSSMYSPLGCCRMIPVSTPCSSRCTSLRCRPRQIRLVTQ